MNKKIWNVCELLIETKDGKDAFQKNIESTNSTPSRTSSFDSYEEAKAYWDTLSTEVRYDPFHRIYVHTGKYIEPIVVDEDGDYVSDDGCFYDVEVPDFEKDDDDNEYEEAED